ncbi:MAG TPA: four-helix bundle copper-binding protein [Polyangiales bacterium]|nr:four-helix bundle copper-binding protein [Polyangiales bacterium]
MSWIHEMIAATPGKPDKFADCIEVCSDCELACRMCAEACLAERELAPLRRCIAYDLDCADICGVTARVLARARDFDPELLRAQLQACVQACVLCGSECEAHAGMHAHCKLCASQCRRCEDLCRQTIGKLPIRH